MTWHILGNIYRQNLYICCGLNHFLQVINLVFHSPTMIIYVVRVMSISESAFSSLQVVDNIPDEILKIRHEIEAEFLGEDQNWGRGETNVSLWTILLPVLSIYGILKLMEPQIVFFYTACKTFFSGCWLSCNKFVDSTFGFVFWGLFIIWWICCTLYVRFSISFLFSGTKSISESLFWAR